MVRLTTPTFILTFEEDLDFTEAGHVYVSLKQGYVELIKQDADLEIGDHQISVFLTQEETSQFGPGQLELMVNWTYEDGRLRGSSDIKTVKVTKNLLDRVVE